MYAETVAILLLFFEIKGSSLQSFLISFLTSNGMSFPRIQSPLIQANLANASTTIFPSSHLGRVGSTELHHDSTVLSADS